MDRHPRISVVIPVYNEESVLPELLQRLGAVLDGLPGGPHEVVFVDDGSSDGSMALLAHAAAEDARLCVIGLSRNFGHQAAITAGLDQVSGDVTIVMDADLQDPPEEIERLLEVHRRGYDVVYATRANRHESWALRASYYAFYRLAALLSETPLPLDAGDFALLSRPVVEALRTTRERQRYLRGLRAWVGFRQTAISVARGRRGAGDAKYTVAKLVKLALDGFFAFSTVPLRVATVLGCVAVAISLCYATYALYARFILNQSPQGFTALIVAIVFLSGVQLFFLGIIGEYIGRTYEEAKGRPIYIVHRIVKRQG